MYHCPVHSTSSYKKMNLINIFRKLWEQHGLWTRSFIVSTAAGLDDLELVTQRLLRNPSDFAAELRNFYGTAKAKRFEDLLTGHLTIAAQLVNAAKNGDTETVNTSRKEWYRNADEIALFLASINPYWSQTEWQAMLYDHLELVENEAIYRLQKNYAADIALYDIIEDQALAMADVMSAGIIKQFSL